MRLLRKFTIARIVFELILLGLLILLAIATLLFWNESGGLKTLVSLVLAITLLILSIMFFFYILKKENSLHRKNTLERFIFQKNALKERKRINELLEEQPLIRAQLSRVLSSGLIWMRMLRYEQFMRLLFFSLIVLVFWLVFDFRFRRSMVIGLMVVFPIAFIWHAIITRRIAILFEKEFPAGSDERATAIDYLYNNKYTYWFASILLKVVGL